ncbi:MarR family winged helix-turn-helix transcriptional regulator [Planococcus halocryophilus]|nr:MarR family winged helix-turn-helix transcriptional regulator [Planococcus halocryophilus]
MIGVNRLTPSVELQNLNLIDLLSERHIAARKIAEQAWDKESEIQISNSEWTIMAHIYKQQPTIASVTKNLDITRQATHKFIKNLAAKGLVEVQNVENNKKDKCIRLTAVGEGCHEKHEVLKKQLESQIADKIGANQLKILKDILKAEWGI